MQSSKTTIPQISIIIDNDRFIFSKDNLYISLQKDFSSHSILPSLPSNLPPNAKTIPSYGIVGKIPTENIPYLIYITEVNLVGTILTSNVFQIKKWSFLPCSNTEIDTINSKDVKYLQMIKDFLERNPLYFSDSFDLTLSFYQMEKCYEDKINNIKNINSVIFPYTVNEYCWNYCIADVLDKEGMNEFVFPIINGFFGTYNNNEYETFIQVILIGRKDLRRNGMRFLFRGADQSGNVANFVETEQILITKSRKQREYITLISFIGIRGSIPLVWSSYPCFKLNPKIKPIEDFHENLKVFTFHVNEMIDKYKSLFCVNLIDKKKDQKLIGDKYTELVTNYKEKNPNKKDKLEYTWFDFHSECKGLKYHNINKLLQQEEVRKCLKDYQYTQVNIHEKHLFNDLIDSKLKLEQKLLENDLIQYTKIQKGVFRNNCIDSLDRSNVTQSYFARYTLVKILNELDLSSVTIYNTEENLNNPKTTEFKRVFERQFRNIWADHGNGISLAYSGTDALKGTFVRTGKSNLLGLTKDGYLSCKRFYINNLCDGYNQDCHDYFLGILNPKNGKFKKHSKLSLHCLIVLALILSIMLSRKVPEFSNGLVTSIFKALLFVLIFVGVIFLAFRFLKILFIDWHTNYERRPKTIKQRKI